MTGADDSAVGEDRSADGLGRLALAGYRRRVAEMYARVRALDDSESAWREFKGARDRLFEQHPQSALTGPQRESFEGLAYFDYDPTLRFRAAVEPDPEGQTFEVTLDQDGETRLRRVGWVSFEVAENTGRLAVYWLEGYGGGLFLPFRDRTNGEQTYAGGRYLLDTIKGADLGGHDGQLVVDFNFAYNPSCAYNPRWHCPLPPPENWLRFPVRAGEKAFVEGEMEPPREDAFPDPE